MAVPLRPLADGIIAAMMIGGALIFLFAASADAWKHGLALIGLGLFLFGGLPHGRGGPK